jgi:hypothetical protein
VTTANQAETPDSEDAAGQQPPRRRISGPVSWLLFSAGILVCLAVAAAGIWIYTMPYPLQTYLEARKAARYHPEWMVSEADYRQARAPVEKRMAWREIIIKVTVHSPAEIEFDTMQYWRGPLYGWGRTFVADNVSGVWTVKETGQWSS